MLEINFKEFLENNGPGVSYLPSDFTGSEAPQKFDGRPPFLSSLDVILPSITRTAKIRALELNKNPVFIQLTDGSKLYLTWPEFRRISGQKPEVGRTLTVVFQRNPNDTSAATSKINSILCH